MEGCHNILMILVIGGSGILMMVFCISSMLREIKKRKKMLQDMETPMEEIPPVSVGAKVVSKRTQIVYGRSYRLPKHEVVFLITFLTDDGETKEFAVSQEKYEKIHSSQMGTLVILNGRFYDFGDGESV